MTASCSCNTFVGCTSMRQISRSATSQRCPTELRSVKLLKDLLRDLGNSERAFLLFSTCYDNYCSLLTHTKGRQKFLGFYKYKNLTLFISYLCSLTHFYSYSRGNYFLLQCAQLSVYKAVITVIVSLPILAFSLELYCDNILNLQCVIWKTWTYVCLFVLALR